MNEIFKLEKVQRMTEKSKINKEELIRLINEDLQKTAAVGQYKTKFVIRSDYKYISEIVIKEMILAGYKIEKINELTILINWE